MPRTFSGTAALAAQTLLLGLLAACAHPITTHLPANRFDSPEASGDFMKGDFGGGLEGGNQFDITPDVDQNPPSFANPGFARSDDDEFLGLDLGLLSRLDFGVKVRFNTTTLAELKYQLFGDPRITAKAGNLSFAVTAGAGGATLTNDNQVGLDDPGVTASSSISETDVDFGAILGYRQVDDVLFYGGPFYTRRIYSGSITQTVNSASPTVYDFNGSLEQVGFNIGAMMGGNRQPFFAKVEYAGAWTSSVGLETFGGYVGGEIGFAWGGVTASSKNAPRTK